MDRSPSPLGPDSTNDALLPGHPPAPDAPDDDPALAHTYRSLSRLKHHQQRLASSLGAHPDDAPLGGGTWAARRVPGAADRLRCFRTAVPATLLQVQRRPKPVAKQPPSSPPPQGTHNRSRSPNVGWTPDNATEEAAVAAAAAAQRSILRRHSATIAAAAAAAAAATVGTEEGAPAGDADEGEVADVKPLSPSESIGLLYSPHALVRTSLRNSKMAGRRRRSKLTDRRPGRSLLEASLPEAGAEADPAVAHFLPLEDFDDEELDLCPPAEWVAKGCGRGGTPARSKFYLDSTHWVWYACRVMAYEEERREFLIVWTDTGKEKWVKRLNLIFDEEDAETWQSRLEDAVELRTDAEAQARLWLYVNSMPESCVGPTEAEQVDRILRLVLPDPRASPSPSLVAVLAEVQEMRTFGAKKGVFHYRCLDPWERQRLQPLRLPPPPTPGPAPLRGTVAIPAHPFESKRVYIEDNLFFTHRLLAKSIFTIVDRFQCFVDRPLVDTRLARLAVPCLPGAFTAHQQGVAQETAESLRTEWTSFVVGTLQQDLEAHFNFYEDDLDRYRASRMSRFFRTVNLVMSTQLRALQEGGLRDYVDFLRRYDPPDSSGPPLGAVGGSTPLFLIHLVARGQNIVFEPSLEEVADAVQSVLQNIFWATAELAGVGEQLFPLLALGKAFLTGLQQEDAAVRAAVQIMERLVQRNTAGPDALRRQYAAFAHLLREDAAAVCRGFAARNPSLEDYDEAMQRLHRDVGEVEQRSPNQVNFDLVRVECMDAKGSLVERAVQQLDGLANQLAAKVDADTQQLQGVYERMYAQISVQPNTPEELQELKAYTDQCQHQMERLVDQFDHITAAVQLLHKFQRALPDAGYRAYWAVCGWPRRVQDVLDDAETHYKESRHRFLHQLREDTEALTEDIGSLGRALEQFATYADEARTEEYYQSVQYVAERIKLYKERIALYNQREKMFHLPTSSHSMLNDIAKHFEPFELLWTIAYRVGQQYPQWHEGLFQHLDAELIDNNVRSWLQSLTHLMGLMRQEEPGRVVASLLERLTLFQPHIPLIAALRNPGLRDRHWKAISQICGKPIRMGEETTFAMLLAQNLPAFLREIQEVSATATQEYNLEKQLERMQAEWKAVTFELLPWRETAVLRPRPAVQRLLDDHVVQTQAMLAVPYIKALEAPVLQWEAKLLRMQLVLDEWLACQALLQLVHPIFAAPDIQKLLPMDTQKLAAVYTMWVTCMETTVKNPAVLPRTQEERILTNLTEANKVLERCVRQLYSLLDRKRAAFARFYFVSNDEMLRMMACGQEPAMLQSYLSRCFPGIARLEFQDEVTAVAMCSAEGESVPFVEELHAGAHVHCIESWLAEVERAMQRTMRSLMAAAVETYPGQPRPEWLAEWPGAVALCVAEHGWAAEVEQQLGQQAGWAGLQALEAKASDLLQLLCQQVTQLEAGCLERRTLENFILGELHHREVLTALRHTEVPDTTAVLWQAQLRYNIVPAGKELSMTLQQGPATLEYGFEYHGNSPRLVATPALHRCRYGLAAALHQQLGVALAGPVGCGKTELLRDFARAAGRPYVVVGCTRRLGLADLLRTSMGLASAAFWGCFDGVQHLDGPQLSLVADQVHLLHTALHTGRPEVVMDGTLVKVRRGCAVVLTREAEGPGCTALPANLQCMFRPVAVTLPDWPVVAQATLHAKGFAHAAYIASKLHAIADLCRAVLSPQAHYQFDGRLIMSIIRQAELYRASSAEEDEWPAVLRAVLHVVAPLLLEDDVLLFHAVVRDVFVEAELPADPPEEHLAAACSQALIQRSLQPEENLVRRMVQFYEACCSQRGVLMVGETCTGKTTTVEGVVRAVAAAADPMPEDWQPLRVVCPKAMTAQELYGAYDEPLHWTDGVLSYFCQQSVQQSAAVEGRQWLLLDGPLDPLWADGLLTALDATGRLGLPSGDFLPLPPALNLVVETPTLEFASPAMVSRCAVVHFGAETLSWQALFQTFAGQLEPSLQAQPKALGWLRSILDLLMDPLGSFLHDFSATAVLPIQPMAVLARLLQVVRPALLDLPTPADSETAEREQQLFVEGHALCAFVWAAGGLLNHNGKLSFDKWLRAQVAATQEGLGRKRRAEEEGKAYTCLLYWPEAGTVFDYVFHRGLGRLAPSPLDEMAVTRPDHTPLSEAVVPTADVAHCAYWWGCAVRQEVPVPFLLVGPPGTCKSNLLRSLMGDLDQERHILVTVQGCGAFTGGDLRVALARRLEQRMKGVFGPPVGKRLAVLLDDLHLAHRDEFGSQTAAEVLRQVLAHGGWHEPHRGHIVFKAVRGLLLQCALQGRQGGPAVPGRLLRHFFAVALDEPEPDTLRHVFQTLFAEATPTPPWPDFIVSVRAEVVEASLKLLKSLQQRLPPQSTTPQYAFGLRDASRLLQMVSQVEPSTVGDRLYLVRLWANECHRLFGDRLVSKADLWTLEETVQAAAVTAFQTQLEDAHPFIDFHRPEAYYEEVPDVGVVKAAFERVVREYNALHAEVEDVVPSGYLLRHASFLGRVLRQPCGHGLLLGDWGTGRRTVGQLAAFLAGVRFAAPRPSRPYGGEDWGRDLKQALCGCLREDFPTAFVVGDAQLAVAGAALHLSLLVTPGHIAELLGRQEFDDATEELQEACHLPAGSSRELVLRTATQRLERLLHVVVCMDPNSADNGKRLGLYPAILKHCVVTWHSSWTSEAFHSVADQKLSKVPELPEDQRESIAELLELMHQLVLEKCLPASPAEPQTLCFHPFHFFEAIATFQALLRERRQVSRRVGGQYNAAIQHIINMEQEAAALRKTMDAVRPRLVLTAEETEMLIHNIEFETVEVERLRSVIAVDEAHCHIKAAAAKVLREECDLGMEEAAPALEAATKTITLITKKELAELRGIATPNDNVRRVVEAACICLEEQPKKMMQSMGGKVLPIHDYWEVAKKRLLADPAVFSSRLLNYDKNNMKQAVVDRLQPYLKDKNFRPDALKSVSKVLVALGQWVIAMEKYHRVYRLVKPKLDLLAAAEMEFDVVMTRLSQKKAELAALDEKMAGLQRALEANAMKKQQLEALQETAQVKVTRAEQLKIVLGNELVRLRKSAEEHRAAAANLMGDVVLSTGMLTYLGPFDAKGRSDLVAEWMTLCRAKCIAFNPSFSLLGFLGEPQLSLEWKTMGLPGDAFTLESAMLAVRSRRWPLLVDPQGHGRQWLRMMERPAKLVTLRLSEPDLHARIMACIKAGVPVLLEDVTERLDPCLDLLLHKQVTLVDGKTMMFVGGLSVEYNPAFRLYLTTRLAQPQLDAKTSEQVAMINFRLDHDGLTQLLLQYTLQYEEKEVAERSTKFVQQELQLLQRERMTEDGMLTILGAGESLLLDDSIIANVDRARQVAEEIHGRTADLHASQRLCDKARARYLPVASHAAQLYACLEDLGRLHPLYQFGLLYFTDLFQRSLRDSPPDSESREQRGANVKAHFATALMQSVGRSLYARHRLLLAFAITCRQLEVDPLYIRALTEVFHEGKEGVEISAPPAWLPDVVWVALQQTRTIRGLEWCVPHVAANDTAWRTFCSDPDAEMPCPPSVELPPLAEVLVVRVLQPQRLLPVVRKWVASHMGPAFLNTAPQSIAASFQEMDQWIPLLFIGTSGVDVVAELGRLTEGRHATRRIEVVSLGPGLEAKATDLLHSCRKQGQWLLLQNCHLCPAWMPTLHDLVEDYSREEVRTAINRDFRLWISTEPFPQLPVPLLREAVKLVLEPPQGLRASLLRAYSQPAALDVPPDQPRAEEGRRLIFGLCYFHAVLQRRGAYHGLGWRRPAEFSDRDLAGAVALCRRYVCGAAEEVPFDGLLHVVGECHYAARLPDATDRGALLALFAEFVSESTLADGHHYPGFASQLPGSVERMPDYIATLPAEEAAEAVGLYSSAGLMRCEEEGQEWLTALQATLSASGEPAALELPAAKVAAAILKGIPEDFDIEAARQRYGEEYLDALEAVAVHEMQRYNALLGAIRTSAQEVLAVSAGQVLPSLAVEDTMVDLRHNVVPQAWHAVSYPSSRPLAAYVDDLRRRVEFLTTWHQNGPPAVFWLPGLFLPTSLFAAWRLNYAHKYGVEADTVLWEDHVVAAESCVAAPPDGGAFGGLFLQGAAWEAKAGVLATLPAEVTNVPFPPVLRQPTCNAPTAAAEARGYPCPLYATARSAGPIGTVALPSFQPRTTWAKSLVALLCCKPD